MYSRSISALMAFTLSTLIVACDGPRPSPQQPQSSTSNNLPDLVLINIVLKAKPPGYGQRDDVIVNTVVRNNGADCRQGFIVRCSYGCSGNPQYFGGMRVTNGLGRNQEITLGDDTLLSLSGCSFESQRQFTCTVDAEALVAESDESNNSRTEVLLTGR